MAQLHSRQGMRAVCARWLGFCGLVIVLLAASAPSLYAQTQLAAVPGAFDDWSPSGRTETLPRAQPTPAPKPVPTPKSGVPLGYSAILGSWCSPGSRYLIERRQLIVILTSGKRVVFPITRFKFAAATVEILWLSGGESKRTIFGRFSADRRRMVQFKVNRTYNRC